MKKVLLFGFETLPEILTVAGIVQQFGGEAVPVAKESCGLTLEALAQGKTGRESGVPIGGKMLVFCGLERELDGLLAALLRAHGIRVLGESQVLELLAPDGEKP